MDMNTLLYLKWITNKDLPYSTWNSAQCYMAAWMGGEFGGEWIHTCTCMAESIHCSLETITTLLISYTPIQNRASLVAQMIKNLPTMQETWVLSLS